MIILQHSSWMTISADVTLLFPAVGGAILSLAFGPEVFAQILDGAAEEDKLATNKNILENPDMLDALIGVYERNVLGYPSTAVLTIFTGIEPFPCTFTAV